VIFTKTFWLETLERSIKTSAQSVAVLFTLGELTPLPALNVTLMWQAAVTGALYSVLTSIGSAPFGKAASPSLVQDEPGLDEGVAMNENGNVDLGTVVTVLLIVILVIVLLRLV
jgi:hypothetical protein